MFHLVRADILDRALLVGLTAGLAGPVSFAPASAATDESPRPESASSLSLDDTLELTEHRHPSVAAARARMLAARSEREQAGAWANPRLGLDAEGFGGDDGSGLEPGEFTATLGWPLNSLLTRGPRASIAQAHVELARAELRRVSWELASATRLAYHDALVADQRVELARQRLDLTEKTVEAFRIQVEAGEASPIQLLRAEVEHETAHSDLVSTRAERRTAHRELAALWAGSADEPLTLTGTLREDVCVGEPDALDRELAERHPLLLESRWRQEIESRGETLASRERWPELSPRAGIRWLPESDDQDFVAGVGLELPLFDRRGAARQAAARRTEAAEQDLQALQLALRTRLRTALDELRARARTLEDYDERIVPRAQDALDRVRIGQQAGKFGALELLDAQRALVAAQQGRVRAHAIYDRVVVQLESLLGRGLDRDPTSPTDSPVEENRP